MKIALVSHAVDTHSGSRAPIELAKAFVKLGHEVFFFAYREISNSKAVKELESAKVKVILIKSPKYKFIGRILSLITLTKELRILKPDIISSHTMLPFILGAKLSGYPIVYTYMGTQLDVWNDKIFPRTPNIGDKLINNALNFLIIISIKVQILISNHVIAFSKYCAKEIYALYDKKAPVVYWGKAPESMLKTKIKKKKSASFNLLSVSRITPYKGFHTLIEAVRELEEKFPNLKLTIIGSQPNKNYFSYLKKIKSKNTKILVNPDDQILSKYYQGSDIYATCDRFLFFGMPIFEAASFAKPAIAFNFASANEIIQHNRTGIIVSSKEEFKKAIIKLIKSDKKRLTLGRNALKLNKKYAWENTAAFYIKLFKKWQKK